uniref:Low-density lipoprotein receptor domain class A n=1 Tax=Heterorhabditis bacteriophora TaxID=37862 RepID=A0A1I7XFW0_HETBA
MSASSAVMSGFTVVCGQYCDEGRWVSVLPRKIYVWSLAYATVVALGNPYCLRLPALVLVNNRDVLLRLACRGVDTPFLTSPDKVNGLKGFNMSWTEVREVSDMADCSSPYEYMCTYSKLCISSRLRCNGDENCGYQDDTDETHCETPHSTVYGSLSMLFSLAQPTLPTLTCFMLMCSLIIQIQGFA